MRDTFRLKNAPWYGVLLTVLFTLGIVFLPSDWLGRLFTDDPRAATLLGRSVLRLVGFGFLLFLMLNVGFKPFMFDKSLLAVLPLYLVAVNNLPIVTLLSGAVRVEYAALIPLLALECLAVALLEETAFRGLVFPFTLRAFAGKKHGALFAILVSSGLFGLIHLVNIRSGIGVTLLQIGYSALIGAVCALIVLYTRNLPAAVLFHAVYNFCGFLIPTLGAGDPWSVGEIVLTAVVAVLVAGYAFFLLYKTPTENARLLAGDPPEAPNGADDRAI